MKYKNSKRLLFLLIVIALTSCNTSITLSDGTIAHPPKKKDVEQHLATCDIHSLIWDHTCQSKLNDKIYQCLYDNNYKTYGEIKQCKSWSHLDPVLEQMYDEKLMGYRKKTISSFSSMSIPDIAEYYKSHNDEVEFLDPAIQSVYIDNLSDMEYPDVRKLDRSFRHTHFTDTIHSVRLQMKEVSLPIIKKNVEKYCKEESKIFASVKEKCKRQVMQFLPQVLEGITDDLLENDLPKGTNEILSFYQETCTKHFPAEKIESIINSELGILAKDITEGRAELSQELDDFVTKFSLLEFPNIAVSTPTFKCPLRDMQEVSRLQHNSDYGLRDLAVDAISLFLTGGWGLALTAADMAYSAYQASADAKQTTPYLNRIVKDVGTHTKNALSQTVDNAFKKINKSFNTNQNQYKKSIYANY